MGNQNASHTSTLFQSLKELPIPFWQHQCILNKDELLICGGWNQKNCYSYHTLKNKYKFICKYPTDTLLGHCVVKLVENGNNNKDINQITLLSFGGFYKHTLMMKYVSVWNENKMNKSKKLKTSNNYNEWIPFTDNHNNPIIIGRYEDNYWGARAVIGGSNSHLLFITYRDKNISIFNLNTFQFIKHDTLPADNVIFYHCFVSTPENGQGQKMIKTNKKIYEMILFCKNTGLSIEYDEDNNTLQFHQLPICDDIEPLFAYAYVRINDIILFFGGYNHIYSKLVCQYSIQEKTWITFKHTLPIPLYHCIGILNKNNNCIHIIGGNNDKHITVSTHMKTKISEWRNASNLVISIFNTFVIFYFFIIKYDYILLYKTEQSNNEIRLIIQYWIQILKIKLGWIDSFDKIIIKYIRIS
ncbi:hypothetical protein RFI_01027 [Reticulomyxa filosa]|uniref:Kelch motif family protein n=1 Tax=Reticulomyxa filosa TaxID=46433 RepID=X6PC00_RETFI|nr:hypothetical protein RFI_01027 [Reticulomyxa filosa]|eukprot:ETO36035.1 hypothetical protein RFI_01027 [Reticulomyxa filosa]